MSKQITVLDFENADIGRLAIHLADCWRPEAAEAIPLTVGPAAFTAYTGYGVLLGWGFVDTSAAVNVLTVHDGADAGAPQLAVVGVPASGSVTTWCAVPGIRIERGLTVAATGAGTAILYLARNVRHD